MDKTDERRKEQRLHYHWPIWFAKDFNESLSQGEMVDLNSSAARFTCHADENCPYLGQCITARFSVPRFGEDDSFDMANFIRPGHVCRVDNVNRFLRCIAVQFTEPLPFKPGEQADNETDQQQRPKAAVI